MFAGNLDALMSAGRPTWQALRARLQDLLSEGGDADLTDDDVVRGRGLHPIDGLTLVQPFTVADYVDFYCSINHATNMGRILRPDDEPLLDNWRHLPVGYHGRAGTVAVSGTDVVRPNGLRAGPDAPTFGPTRRMDFELEVGMVVGAGSSIGRPVEVDAFDEHVFGLCLVNDWSARDIQGYEYRPLGPFLGKSFLTSIAPWVLPLDAVAPAFTVAPAQEPTPVAYLRAERNWALPIRLEVLLQTAAMRERGEDPVTIATTDFVDTYWTFAQMLAHATVNGASLRVGDLFASGTVSGTEPGTYGSMMELSWGGQQPLELPSGETRTFLQDGDAVTLRGVTTLPDGTAVGWADVTGTVHAALDLPGATP
jgi:fumarylacetoacetase